MKSYLVVVLAFFILFPFLCPAQQLNSDQEQRIQKLEKIILEQEQRIQDLQNKVGQPSKEYTEQVVREYLNRPEVAEAQTIAAGYEEGKGFFVRTLNQDFELYMSGLIQMGVGFFENQTRDNNSVYPNGVSLAFDAYLYQQWHGRIQFNLWGAHGDNLFQGGGLDGIQLWDAYIEYMGTPEFNVRVGNTHVPFTMEGQYDPQQGISIWHEPYINKWSHGRDPGLMILGTLSDMFEYKVSIHNGENGMNGNDDMLMAAGFRVYPLEKSKNPNTFFHVGVLRNRNAPANVNNNGAALTSPWTRPIYGATDTDGNGINDYFPQQTRGWETGVDVAARYDDYLGDDKVNSVRAEIEFMYMTWERKLSTGGGSYTRFPYLEGYGLTMGLSFKHNLTPDIEGAGIFPLFKFSFSDVDNKETDDAPPYPENLTNVVGQRAFTYTFGVGYAFNKHVWANFNWVIMNLDEQEACNGTKDRDDVSGDLEHAWFFQLTAVW
jgi:hypothetical protein